MYDSGTQIVLTPTVNAGSKFEKWIIGDNDYLTETSATGINVDENGILTYTVLDDVTITAVFTTSQYFAEVSKSYVGYYVYVDGIWGIIYADLLAQTKRSGYWGDGDGSWNISSASTNPNNYKSYIVSDLPLSNGPSIFGEYSNTGVIILSSSSIGNNYRFYVMETSDRGGNVNWNTAKSMTAGTTKKWVCPTREQWSIFGSAFNLTGSNYSNQYKLSSLYWTSSTASDSSKAWYVNCPSGYVYYRARTNNYCVRLCTTY